MVRQLSPAMLVLVAYYVPACCQTRQAGIILHCITYEELVHAAQEHMHVGRTLVKYCVLQKKH